MGFNPHRKQKKRSSDIYIVVVALAITLSLVIWAFAA
jgi:cytochrome c-type biogenesis protein CcmE